MHRNIHGQKGDHALLACTWNWRIRTEKKRPTKDFSLFRGGASPKQAALIQEFDDAVQLKLDQLQYDVFADSATTMYDKMCEAIGHAVETVLPTVTSKPGVFRKVSERTQALFKRRTDMAGTKAEYKKV